MKSWLAMTSVFKNLENFQQLFLDMYSVRESELEQKLRRLSWFYTENLQRAKQCIPFQSEFK